MSDMSFTDFYKILTPSTIGTKDLSIESEGVGFSIIGSHIPESPTESPSNAIRYTIVNGSSTTVFGCYRSSITSNDVLNYVESIGQIGVTVSNDDLEASTFNSYANGYNVKSSQIWTASNKIKVEKFPATLNAVDTITPFTSNISFTSNFTEPSISIIEESYSVNITPPSIADVEVTTGGATTPQISSISTALADITVSDFQEICGFFEPSENQNCLSNTNGNISNDSGVRYIWLDKTSTTYTLNFYASKNFKIKDSNDVEYNITGAIESDDIKDNVLGLTPERYISYVVGEIDPNTNKKYGFQIENTGDNSATVYVDDIHEHPTTLDFKTKDGLRFTLNAIGG